jgi:peptidyl-prolyl cis-trans isomerase SurA
VIRTGRRRPSVVAVVVAAGLLLSGCGGSLGIHPGAAATVGDQTVSMSTIDSTTTSFCRAYVKQAQQSQQGSSALPMGTFRAFVASSLAKRLLGRELADAYGVQPASGYQQQVAQYEQALAGSPAAERDAVVQVAGADAYLQNVQIAIGQQLTGNTGIANADVKAQLQRGVVATQDWLNDHEASVDPVFGVAVDGGKFTTGQHDQTSYAVSSLARGGVEADTGGQGPPDSYTSALATSQICQ